MKGMTHLQRLFRGRRETKSFREVLEERRRGRWLLRERREQMVRRIQRCFKRHCFKRRLANRIVNKANKGNIPCNFSGTHSRAVGDYKAFNITYIVNTPAVITQAAAALLTLDFKNVR
jgi:hypothetical protein